VLRISIRQRRAARLAVVALGGCIALAACGSSQFGSAAIVGGDRITSSTLASEVSSLNHGYHANKVRLAFPASQMPQVVLAWLLRFRIRDELARREGITVSQTEIQQAINQIASQGKTSGIPSLTALAVQNGLPPNLVNSDLGRYQAIANAFVNRLDGGQAPSSSTGQQALNQAFDHAQCTAAKNLNIKVNPQFGRFDYGQLNVVPPANTLSAPGLGASPSPAASPSVKPQFTPPC
jgi:peptidyl-prolyl cis-trans isomerase SurA